MKDVGLTAKWERALGMVAEGKASGEQLRAKVCSTLKDMIGGISSKKKS